MSLKKIEEESESNPFGISVRSLDSRTSDDEATEKCSVGLSSSGGSGALGSSTHEIVQETMRDVVRLQQDAMHHIRETAERQKSSSVTRRFYEEALHKYENERLEHEKTKLLLEKQSEKLEFAEGEIEILTKHLEKEKKTHKELLKSVKEKASRETRRSDLLHNKCNKIEETVEKQSDDLYLKENEISHLKQRLHRQREAYHQTLQELEIQKVQEAYMAKTLNGKKQKKHRRGIS